MSDWDYEGLVGTEFHGKRVVHGRSDLHDGLYVRFALRALSWCVLAALLLILAAVRAFGADAQANALLISEGQRIGVQSLRTGKQHSVLQAMAQRHADYQARCGVQGHQGWNSRVQELYRDVADCGTFSEVANESWPGQDNRAAAAEMYHSWRQSPGHWSAVNGRCAYWGYAMSFCPGNRTWYAAGVFGESRRFR